MSWVTVKEIENFMDLEDQDSDSNEETEKIGILILRSAYTEGLNALHCSKNYDDESWMAAKTYFEKILSVTEDMSDETAAVRSERKLLLFLSLSNLSRMLSKSTQKDLALHYALEATSLLSIRDINIQDPGLLLRIAKLTLEKGDMWSCKHILAYRLSQDNQIVNSNEGGLLDSFLQLYENMQEQYVMSPMQFNREIFISKKNIIKLQIEKPLLDSTNLSDITDYNCEIFNKLSACLNTQGHKNSLNNTLLMSYVENNKIYDEMDIYIPPVNIDENENDKKIDVNNTLSTSELAISVANSYNDRKSYRSSNNVSDQKINKSLRDDTIQTRRKKDESSSLVSKFQKLRVQ